MVIEGTLQVARRSISPEAASCMIGQQDAFVLEYDKTCSSALTNNSPLDSISKTLLAKCFSPPTEPLISARPPLKQQTAPPLDCPADTGAQRVENGSAEYCARADGSLEGPAREWFPNGSQRSADLWVSGKQSGIWFSWEETGACARAATYRDGLLEGAEVYWFPNGQRRTLTWYRQGKKNGVVAEWAATGRPLLLGSFQDNEAHGLWYFNSPEGEKAVRTTFEHGHKRKSEPSTFPFHD